MFGFGGFSGAGEDLNSHEGSSYGEEDDGELQLTPQEIVHCAQSIGVTVEGSSDGWNPLVKVVQGRERQNRVERKGSKSMRKGVRELNNLNCSINYDKAIQRKGDKTKGAFPSSK
eukprot:TRINITY_DN23025_c1_g2_i1.p2 TRINITY_DN23025_c1_g2~~TRINITY_DN23025_c1_g2_i1.p2  ORF type:complete len:115 (-),score=22.77 TRINITY_DN23025_c1_g2_i1:136-480(-)